MLGNGFPYLDIKVCEKMFVICCILHNFLLDLIERNNVRVGHGYPIGDDGLWPDGHTNNVDDCLRMLAIKFALQRDKLAKHLKVFKKKGQVIQELY